MLLKVPFKIHVFKYCCFFFLREKNSAASHEAEEEVFTSQEKQDDTAPVGAVGFHFGDRRFSLPDRSVSAVHEDIPVGTSSHDDDDNDDFFPWQT